jgi:CMP/dCMP kinase
MGKFIPVVTIDGPGGSGKGTVSRAIARRLGWHFLDSGALYRAVALAALRAAVDLDSAVEVEACTRKQRIKFVEQGADDARVMLSGVDVTDELRTESCAAAASKVAVLPAVRAALLDKQRELRLAPGLVADGRDMGTVVFPDAVLKVFLEASAEERAQRRYKQLKEKALSVNLHDLLEEIAQRDHRDRTRAVAPLVPAQDALIVDSTSMSIAEVVETIMTALVERDIR